MVAAERGQVNREVALNGHQHAHDGGWQFLGRGCAATWAPGWRQRAGDSEPSGVIAGWCVKFCYVGGARRALVWDLRMWRRATAIDRGHRLRPFPEAISPRAQKTPAPAARAFACVASARAINPGIRYTTARRWPVSRHAREREPPTRTPDEKH